MEKMLRKFVERVKNTPELRKKFESCKDLKESYAKFKHELNGCSYEEYEKFFKDVVAKKSPLSIDELQSVSGGLSLKNLLAPAALLAMFAAAPTVAHIAGLENMSIEMQAYASSDDSDEDWEMEESSGDEEGLTTGKRPQDKRFSQRKAAAGANTRRNWTSSLESEEERNGENYEVHKPAAKKRRMNTDFNSTAANSFASLQDATTTFGSETELSDAILEIVKAAEAAKKNRQTNVGQVNEVEVLEEGHVEPTDEGMRQSSGSSTETDEEMNAADAAAQSKIFAVADYTATTATGEKVFDIDGNEINLSNDHFDKKGLQYRVVKSNYISVTSRHKQKPLLNVFYDGNSTEKKIFCMQLNDGLLDEAIYVKPNVTYVVRCQNGNNKSFTANEETQITLVKNGDTWDLVDKEKNVVVKSLEVGMPKSRHIEATPPSDLTGANALHGVEMNTIVAFHCGILPSDRCGSGEAGLVSGENCYKIATGQRNGVRCEHLCYYNTNTSFISVRHNGHGKSTPTLASCWSLEKGKPYVMRFVPSLLNRPLNVAKGTLYAIRCADETVRFFRPTEDGQQVTLVKDGTKWNLVDKNKNVVVESLEVGMAKSRHIKATPPSNLTGANALHGVEMNTIGAFHCGILPPDSCGSGEAGLVSGENCYKIATGQRNGVICEHLCYYNANTPFISVSHNGHGKSTPTLASCWSLEKGKPYVMHFVPSLLNRPLNVAKGTLYAIRCADETVRFFRPTEDGQQVTLVKDGTKWNLVDKNKNVVVESLDVSIAGSHHIEATPPSDLTGANALGGVTLTTIGAFHCGILPSNRCGSGEAGLVIGETCTKIATGKPNGVTCNYLYYYCNATNQFIRVRLNKSRMSSTPTLASCWSLADNKPYAMRFSTSLQNRTLNVAKDTLYAIWCTNDTVRFFRPTDDGRCVKLVKESENWEIKVATLNKDTWETGDTLVECVNVSTAGKPAGDGGKKHKSANKADDTSKPPAKMPRTLASESVSTFERTDDSSNLTMTTMPVTPSRLTDGAFTMQSDDLDKGMRQSSGSNTETDKEVNAATAAQQREIFEVADYDAPTATGEKVFDTKGTVTAPPSLYDEFLNMESKKVENSNFKVGKFDLAYRGGNEVYRMIKSAEGEPIDVSKQFLEKCLCRSNIVYLGTREFISLSALRKESGNHRLFPCVDEYNLPWLMYFTKSIVGIPLLVIPNHRYAICCGDRGNAISYFFEATAPEQYIKVVEEGEQYVLKGASDRNVPEADWKTLIKNVYVKTGNGK